VTERPEWMYPQRLYIEPRAGGEERIFGFDNNKQTKKRTKLRQPRQPNDLTYLARDPG